MRLIHVSCHAQHKIMGILLPLRSSIIALCSKLTKEEDVIVVMQLSVSNFFMFFILSELNVHRPRFLEQSLLGSL